MKSRTSIRVATAGIIVACACAVLYLWIARNSMARAEWMLIPLAPFCLLGVIAWHAASLLAGRLALALMILFAAFSAGRVIYGFYMPYGDEWLLLNILIIGMWQVGIAIVFLPLSYVIDKRWPIPPPS